MQKLIIIFSLFLTSCATPHLVDKKPNKVNTVSEVNPVSEVNNSYDTVKGFVISSGARKMSVFGLKHHYIFNDESGELRKILNWKGRSKLEMEIHNFEFLSGKKIKGSVTIKVVDSKNLSAKDVKFLKKSGFTSLVAGKNTPEKLDLVLSGRRYLPRVGVDYEVKNSSNRQYKVSIINNGISKKLEKAALTPVAITSRGVIIIFGSVAYGVTEIGIVASDF